MIVLDTNVVSEAMSLRPAAAVMSWWKQHRASQLYITSVTQAELLLGVALLPRGKRRGSLEAALEDMFEEDFAGRVLNFDTHAAREFARICAARQEMGRPISQVDAQIASIARSHGAGIATRNEKDFAHCGIAVFNPWG